MTIQEAIKHAREVADEKYKEGFLCYANSGNAENDKKNIECVKRARDHEQLAEWLEELQQYKAIETEIKEHYCNINLRILVRGIIETVFEGEGHDGFRILTNEHTKMWEEYQEIGMVEECREARERQIAKKVKNRKLLRDFYNRPYSVRGDCPNCGSIGLLSTNTDYCNACGQKLDWGDAD